MPILTRRLRSQVHYKTTTKQPDGETAASRGATETSRPGAALPSLDHNGGPPLDENDANASWRLRCWRRAKKRAWSAPREIALRRLARAEELGMSYHDYTLEILERGRIL
jgi:hypothetical protein